MKAVRIDTMARTIDAERVKVEFDSHRWPRFPAKSRR